MTPWSGSWATGCGRGSGSWATVVPGSAACISRGRAVISAGKLQFGGSFGWLGWLFIHIGFLTGCRNRIGAIFGWWFAFTRDLRRERTFNLDDMPVAAGAYSGPAQPGDVADTGP